MLGIKKNDQLCEKPTFLTALIAQFEGVRHKFSVPPSAVGFPLNCRKIEPDPVHHKRLQKKVAIE
jgi:hypothetical protein